MNARKSFVALGAALLLAACVTDATPGAAAANASVSPAADAVAKLKKNLTGAEVRALLGAPKSIKPIVVGDAKGENWAYVFTGPTETNMVQVATAQVPATNPLTGRETTRPEPVFQNQDTQAIDTLHLLLFDGRLIEWRVVRNEKKQFQ